MTSAPDLMSEAEVLRMFDTLSNKGRWGADDERGTLNFLTPDKTQAACAGVRSGRVVSVGHDVGLVASRKNKRPAEHRMLYLSDKPFAAVDQITIAPHGYHETHLDAVAHTYFEREHIYNGRTVADTVFADGLSFGSVYVAREGIVGRGVLLDVARARGVDWLGPDDYVTVADLKAAEAMVEGGVQSGDILFVRIGLGSREGLEGPEDPASRAGLIPECLPWLHQREIAVFSGDCFEREPLPYPRCAMPLHMIGSAAMGLCLLDHTAMEPLAAACEEEGRWDFLTTIAPLRIPRATGSPVNPLCIF
jgi:kynurenine formamidase